MTAERYRTVGVAFIAASAGAAVAARFAAEEVAPSLSMFAPLLFVIGVVLLVIGFVRREPPETGPRVAAPSAPQTTDFHRAIERALVAAHPANATEVRLVLRPVDGMRFEPEITTLARPGAPPSLRREIDAYAAHLVAREEPLEHVTFEGKRGPDGKFRFTLQVKRGELPLPPSARR